MIAANAAEKVDVKTESFMMRTVGQQHFYELMDTAEIGYKIWNTCLDSRD